MIIYILTSFGFLILAKKYIVLNHINYINYLICCMYIKLHLLLLHEIKDSSVIDTTMNNITANDQPSYTGFAFDSNVYLIIHV